MKNNSILKLIAGLMATIMLTLSLSGCMAGVTPEATEDDITDAITEALQELENSLKQTEAEDDTDGDDTTTTDPDDDGNTPPVDPDGDDNTPPVDPDGDGNTPPVDPDGDGNIPPVDPDGDGNTPPVNPDDDNTSSGGGLGELEVVPYTIVYENVSNGRIEGETEQKVLHGKSGSTVVAIPDEDYIFIRWSDGYEHAERTEENVMENMWFYPVYMHKNTTFSVTYTVERAGKTVETKSFSVKIGESISYTPPAPTLAYKFHGWNDGVESASRTDVIYSDKEFKGKYMPHSLGVAAICINTDDEMGIITKEYYRGCTVSLVNAETGQCFENLRAQIRGRGNSSWDAHDKKGFKLKFDEQLKMLGSSYKSKNWNFISNHADKSLLRNMIAYDLSEAFDGLDYTTTHKYIDVYLNGEYHGIYMMCDDLDVGKGRIEYDKTIYEDPAQTAFLLEVGSTHSHDYTNECIKVSRDYSRTYCLKFPDVDDPGYDPAIHKAYIEDYLDQCMAALSAENWDLICQLIDIDSFIDHYIIQELYANKDGFWRSIYFYKEPNGKLYAGPVWDFDQGLGSVNDYFGDDMTTGKDIYDVRPDTDFAYVNSSVHKTAGSPWIACVSTWYRRLLRNEEFKELLRERLAECGPIIMKVIERATTDGSNPDSYYSLYGAAMERNFDYWKIMGTFVWPSSPKLNSITSLKGQITYMREWIVERYDLLCKHYGVST